MKFFMLERYNPYNLVNRQFTADLSGIQSLRLKNLENKYPVNHGLPYSHEEIDELKSFSNEKKPFEDYVQYFQRTGNSIIKSLEINGLEIPEIRKDIIKVIDHAIESPTLEELVNLHKKYSTGRKEKLEVSVEKIVKNKDKTNRDMLIITKLLEIKTSLYSKYSFDIIAVQCGFYYNIYNDHAEKYNALWGYQTYYQGETLLAGFPENSTDRQIRRLKDHKLTYALVSESEKTDDSIIRVVTETSNNDALGESFKLPRKQSSSKKKNKIKPSDSEIIFLNAILNGADPFTGEVLSDDSIWKHPKIISDIKKYLEKHSDK